MIATHNVKVNGRWIRVGEEYGDKETKRAEAEPIAEKAEAKKAEEKPKTVETKPRTTTRRKGTR